MEHYAAKAARLMRVVRHRKMKAPFRLPFWISAGVLAAVLAWLIWQCSKPLLWIVTGDIFREHFRYVKNGMACDSFTCMVGKLHLCIFHPLFNSFPPCGTAAMG